MRVIKERPVESKSLIADEIQRCVKQSPRAISRCPILKRKKKKLARRAHVYISSLLIRLSCSAGGTAIPDDMRDLGAMPDGQRRPDGDESVLEDVADRRPLRLRPGQPEADRANRLARQHILQPAQFAPGVEPGVLRCPRHHRGSPQTGPARARGSVQSRRAALLLFREFY